MGPPGEGQVLAETLVSAISPGTELRIYRGEVPPGMPLDATIPALAGEFAYPLRYGYAAVARVAELGAAVDPGWRGRLVVGFHPHQSHFLARPGELIPVPAGLSPEDAAFLPNVETAVNFLMDGRPIVGERVAVFGQGVVGLLTTALLARLPLTELVALDRHPLRRRWALELGAHAAEDPAAAGVLDRLRGTADLTYELSGDPAALDPAIATTGFGGRVVVGSWYGDRPATLNLGGAFHRSRIELVSSQVSTSAPRWTARWTKARRLEVAWRMLAAIATGPPRHPPLSAGPRRRGLRSPRPPPGGGGAGAAGVRGMRVESPIPAPTSPLSGAAVGETGRGLTPGSPASMFAAGAAAGRAAAGPAPAPGSLRGSSPLAHAAGDERGRAVISPATSPPSRGRGRGDPARRYPTPCSQLRSCARRGSPARRRPPTRGPGGRRGARPHVGGGWFAGSDAGWAGALRRARRYDRGLSL